MSKKLLLKLLVSTFIICMCIGLYVNTVGVTAVDFPAIKVVPELISDTTLLPGDTVKISITTDYDGSDIWSYQFTFSWNPSVLSAGENLTEAWTGDGVNRYFFVTNLPILPGSISVYEGGVLQVEGVDYVYRETHTLGDGLIMFAPGNAPANGAEVRAYYLYGVVNGDLITEAQSDTADFSLGTFNSTEGRSSLTLAYYFYTAPDEPYQTSGPGILANITFTVVGFGHSNLTLGDETKLLGYESGGSYDIIDARTQPGNIQHGYFSNLIPGDMVGDTPGSPPDGDVDRYDFGEFAAAYGSSVGQPKYNALADLVGDTPDSPPDGDVDRYDFGVFAANYGKSNPI
jgi:hypothetical protein